MRMILRLNPLRMSSLQYEVQASSTHPHADVKFSLVHKIYFWSFTASNGDLLMAYIMALSTFSG